MNPAQAAQSPTGSTTAFGMPGQQALSRANNIFNYSSATNPLGFANPQGAYEGERSANALNLYGQAYKQQLAPMFTRSMFGAAQPAESFYGNLMNLGSPYYAQHQSAAFNNALNDYSNAYAQESNQLRGQGLGYGPTGANVAMLGGMGQGFAQDAASQYLQQLFNNELMQLQGAQGLFNTAQLFQPGPLLGAAPVSELGTNPSWTQQFGQFGQGLAGIGSLFSGNRLTGQQPAGGS